MASDPESDDLPAMASDPEYFGSPMNHTPGQRIHTIEGPGRQTSAKCISAEERFVNTGGSAGEPLAFRRRSGTALSMPNAVREPAATELPPAEERPEPAASGECGGGPWSSAAHGAGVEGDEAKAEDEKSGMWHVARAAIAAQEAAQGLEKKAR